MEKMRLIDADKLRHELIMGHDLVGAKYTDLAETVKAIPIELYEQVKGERDVAIEQLKALNIELFEKPYLKAIPIDKPFLKMRYGDYVVYNKKWLVDHLQTEWTILQGKEYQPSIPIEWIKKWCNKEHNRKSLEERLLKRYGVITMLEDWEKENEID